MKIRTGFVSNSSSSSFLCETNMSLKEVKEMLQKLVNIHNEYINDREEKPFDKIFSEPKTLSDGRILIETCYDNSIPFWISEFLEMKFHVNPIHGNIGYLKDGNEN